MENMEKILKWFWSQTPIIVGLFGWAAFLYDRWIATPRIKGKILNVMCGQFPNPQNPNETLTSFLVFLYLTNLHPNSVHILDYELEIEMEDKCGFKKLKRVYGLENTNNPIFLNPKKEEIIIPNLKDYLIYKKQNPIKFGDLYTGLILFAGDKNLYSKKVKKYKIICIDALNKKHKFITDQESFINLYRLLELFGIKLPAQSH